MKNEGRECAPFRRKGKVERRRKAVLARELSLAGNRSPATARFSHPSAFRKSRMAAAAASPMAIPLAFAAPSGISASEAA